MSKSSSADTQHSQSTSLSSSSSLLLISLVPLLNTWIFLVYMYIIELLTTYFFYLKKVLRKCTPRWTMIAHLYAPVSGRWILPCAKFVISITFCSKKNKVRTGVNS